MNKSKQQRNGKRWERYIVLECRALQKAGVAFVSKNFEAPKIPGSHVPREASKPDFSGFLFGGTHIVFEAKSTENKTSFGFALISRGQKKHLALAHKAGAVSFVYVLSGDDEKFVIPWKQIEDCEKKSLKFSDIDDCKKVKGESFLATLARIECE